MTVKKEMRGQTGREGQTINVSEGVPNQEVVSMIVENQNKGDGNYLDRLKADLLTNETADYRRINLTENFVLLGCNPELAATHWRIAKILDAVTYCADQLRIIKDGEFKDGVSPDGIPPKIYSVIREGRVNEKNINIAINDKDGNPKTERASLSDLAHFMDALKTNRELGTFRLSLEELVCKFFSGQDIKVKINKIEDGKKQENESGVVDLRDQTINPRDAYDGFDQKLKKYLDFLKRPDTQQRAAVYANWRHTSEGFRVIGAHSYMVDLDGTLQYIPISGLMAAKVTLEDLQKGDKGGMNGQPQEVGEMDEAETGAIIRFNMSDLAQRRKGGDVRSIQATPRLMKAMVGLTLKEDATRQVEDYKEEGIVRKKVFLCGEKLDGKVIQGIQAHYRKATEKIRGKGFGLSKEEAADIAFTDVFVPCILNNNENDWLLALAKTYGLESSTALINRKDFGFPNFEIVITCLNLETDNIEKQTFKNMRDLRDYYRERIKRGHVDQPLGDLSKKLDTIGTETKLVTPENIYFKEKITDIDGKAIFAALEEILGEDYSYLIKNYVNDGLSGAVECMVVKGRKLKPGEKKKGRRPVTFDQNLNELLLSLPENLRRDFLTRVYGNINFEEDENDSTVVLNGFIETIRCLTKEDRARIKSI